MMIPSEKLLKNLSTLVCAAFLFLPGVCCLGEDNETATQDEVCYNLLGCFSLREPWKSLLRPIPAPMLPEEINTRIYFYSRSNPKRRYEIQLRPRVELGGTPFNSSLPSVIIIHGFAANGNSTWMTAMKDAYLARVNGNVMLVDWGPGASLFNYLQVAGNTRVVGKEIARLVKGLNINPNKLHLIGHSLGSHISSYAAKEIPRTARVTALDPAQPAFEGFDPAVRLDKSDATFVDVIHTDARPLFPTLGLGMMTTAGHVDFYLNGGFDQPGCILPSVDKLPKITSLLDLAKYPVEVLAEIVKCPHGRAYEYFTESLNNTGDCVFWGHKASVPAVLKTVTNTITQGLVTKVTALSPSCSRQDCTPMGLRTKLSALRGSFVVTTNGRSPFCISEDGVPAESNAAKSGSFVGLKKLVSPVLN